MKYDVVFGSRHKRRKSVRPGVTNQVPSGSTTQRAGNGIQKITCFVWLYTFEEKFRSSRARKSNTFWFRAQTTTIVIHGPSIFTYFLVVDTFTTSHNSVLEHHQCPFVQPQAYQISFFSCTALRVQHLKMFSHRFRP